MKKNGTIKLSKVQIAALAEIFERSFLTIQRWAKKGDDRLISDKAREIIKKYS